ADGVRRLEEEAWTHLRQPGRIRSTRRQDLRQFSQERRSVADAEKRRHDAVEGLQGSRERSIRAQGRVLQPVQLVQLELHPVRSRGSIAGHHEYDLLLDAAASNDSGERTYRFLAASSSRIQAGRLGPSPGLPALVAATFRTNPASHKPY